MIKFASLQTNNSAPSGFKIVSSKKATPKSDQVTLLAFVTKR